MDDLILQILAGLAGPDRQEITELTHPRIGDGVYDVNRELRGEYPGGEIVDVNVEEDEYRVNWWDPESGGYQLDTTIFEKLDFIHFSDGKTGRLWHIA